MKLPIQKILPVLKQQLSTTTTVILKADPGAGKSTVVPLELLEETWLSRQKILLLEPRRLAAKSVAARMASTLGESVGERVGYRMRLERKVSAKTQIEVITEGMLTRQLQSDPELQGVGCVIFDEFHERSLQGDLGLALTIDAQQALREDLRIIVMSATLESDALSTLLDGAPVVQCQGRQFPVETYYLPRSEASMPASRIAHITQQTLQQHTGNVLLFLPGIREIKQLETLLNERCTDALITPLYGGLALKEQQLAIQSRPGNHRKIVISTAIAETSLTIEGISIVIDAGLERSTKFNPRTGMSHLVTVTASQASADQRRGRAGRLGPGHCYRLWSESEQAARQHFSEPEIVTADLSALVLELAQWGVSDPATLQWLTPPPEKTYKQAQRLLQSLNILDANNRLTSHGKRIAKLGLHPRIGHMLVIANQAGAGKTACDIAAFFSERTPFTDASSKVDFSARLPLLNSKARNGIHGGIISRVKKQSQAYQHRITRLTRGSTLSPGAICAHAYPDRIGQLRDNKNLTYKLSGGGAASFHSPNQLSNEDYLVITELDGRERSAKIFSAVAITLTEIETLFADQLSNETRVSWNKQQTAIIAEKITTFKTLVLRQAPILKISDDTLLPLMLIAIRQHGLSCFMWDKKSTQWLNRVRFLNRHEKEHSTLPDFSETALLESLESWLAPWIQGFKKLSQLKSLNIKSLLMSRLDWTQQQWIHAQAPTHFQVPSGSRIALTYEENQPPVLAVRIQEMFSCTTTPTIADGKAPLLLHLLSPGQRPVQVTQDLISFWSNSYLEVKKELKGRYPKHHWPDDPLNTQPHATVKPRNKS